MASSKSRGWGIGLLATAGLAGATSMVNPAAASADEDVAGVAAANGTAIIMGYASNPFPNQAYVDRVVDLLLDPSRPFSGETVYPGFDTYVQYTPEETFSYLAGGNPFTGFNTFLYQQSAIQGAAYLDNMGIKDNLDGPELVFGYSSSASAATYEMIHLDSLPVDQRPTDLSFLLVEDLNSPNGGIFERFPFLYNEPATPADTPFHTDIINVEYDGSADFPQYPTNILADLNALMGYTDLHTFLTSAPSTFNVGQLPHAVELLTSSADLNTSYFLVPTMDLPLLDPIRYFPGGNLFADLVQPSLRVLVDLGYDRTGDADVVTPAEFFNPHVDWNVVMADLALGQQQGLTALQVDLGLLPPSALPNMYPYLPDLNGLVHATTSDTSAAASFDPWQSLLSSAFASGNELLSWFNELPDSLSQAFSSLPTLGLDFLG